MSTPATPPTHPLPPVAAVVPPVVPPVQPATPASETPPAAPPAADVEEVIHEPATDPVMQSFYKDLGIEFKDGEVVMLLPPKLEDKEDHVPPAKPVAAAPPPPAAPAVVEPLKPPAAAPIEVEQEEPLSTVVSDAVNRALDARMPRPEPTKSTEPVADPDADYVAALDPVSKHEVALAEFAEKHDPARYKNLRKQTISFLKSVDEYRQQHEGEDGRTFDAQDDEWKKFVGQRRPKISTEEKALIKDEMIATRAEERAYERARRDFAPQIAEAHTKSREIEARPKIEKAVKGFESDVLLLDAGDNEALKEVIEASKTKGAAAAQDIDPVYATIINNNIQTFAPVAAEFMAIANGLKTFNPEDKTHQWIYDFIETQGRHVAQNPQFKVVTAPDGRKRRFVTRSEYAKLSKTDPSKIADVYTFKDQDILDMLAVNTRNIIAGQAKQWQEKLSKAGYARTKASVTPPPAPVPAPVPKPVPVAKSAKVETEDEEDAPPTLGGAPAPGAIPGAGIQEESIFSPEEWKHHMSEQ